MAWPCRATCKAWLSEVTFNQSLDGVTLPSNLQSLTFGRTFNQSLDGVTLPSNLQSLTFGYIVQPKPWWSDLAEQLAKLDFRRYAFNQSLDRATLPSNLQSLTFGDHVQPKALMEWPCRATCKAWLSDVRSTKASIEWPCRATCKAWLSEWSVQPKPWWRDLAEQLAKLDFRIYGSTKALMEWPCRATCKAWLSGIWLQPKPRWIDLVEQLAKLDFRTIRSTKASIEWPCRATCKAWLSECKFNQSLDGVTLPSNLQSLTFGDIVQPKPWWSDLAEQLAKLDFRRWCSTKALMEWPCRATCKAWLSDDTFNQSLDRVTLPSNLQSLTFGYMVQSKALMEWPCRATCDSLIFAGHVQPKALIERDLAEQLAQLDFRTWVQPKPWSSDLAEQLAKLDFRISCSTKALIERPCRATCKAWLSEWTSTKVLMEWPCRATCKAWLSDIWFNQSLDGVTLPSNLQSLTFGGICSTKALIEWPCRATCKAWLSESMFNQSLDQSDLAFGSSLFRLPFYIGQCSLNLDPPFCMDSYVIIRSTSDHHPIPAVLAVHAFIPKNCVCGCAKGSLQSRVLQNHVDYGCSPALYWKYGIYPVVLKRTLHIWAISWSAFTVLHLILFVWERNCTMSFWDISYTISLLYIIFDFISDA